jgi:O-antigen/teichoic acid export membrane protein
LLLPAFLASIVGADHSAMSEAWNRYAGLLIPSLLGVVISVAAAGPLMIIVVADRQYSAAGVVVAFGAIADGLRIVGQILMSGAQATLRLRSLVWPNLAGVIASLLLIMVLSPISPLVGTGVALVTGGIVSAGLLWRAVGKLLDIRFPLRDSAWAVALASPMLLALAYFSHSDEAKSGAQIVMGLSVLVLYSLAVQGIIWRGVLWPSATEPAHGRSV